jgi:hypothetical protein
MSANEVLSYINALKWPVLAGAVVAYFREPLTKIANSFGDSDEGGFTGPFNLG